MNSYLIQGLSVAKGFRVCALELFVIRGLGYKLSGHWLPKISMIIRSRILVLSISGLDFYSEHLHLSHPERIP